MALIEEQSYDFRLARKVRCSCWLYPAADWVILKVMRRLGDVRSGFQAFSPVDVMMQSLQKRYNLGVTLESGLRFAPCPIPDSVVSEGGTYWLGKPPLLIRLVPAKVTAAGRCAEHGVRVFLEFLERQCLVVRDLHILFSDLCQMGWLAISLGHLLH